MTRKKKKKKKEKRKEKKRREERERERERDIRANFVCCIPSNHMSNRRIASGVKGHPSIDHHNISSVYKDGSAARNHALDLAPGQGSVDKLLHDCKRCGAELLVRAEGVEGLYLLMVQHSRLRSDRGMERSR